MTKDEDEIVVLDDSHTSSEFFETLYKEAEQEFKEENEPGKSS